MSNGDTVRVKEVRYYRYRCQICATEQEAVGISADKLSLRCPNCDYENPSTVIEGAPDLEPDAEAAEPEPVIRAVPAVIVEPTHAPRPGADVVFSSNEVRTPEKDSQTNHESARASSVKARPAVRVKQRTNALRATLRPPFEFECDCGEMIVLNPQHKLKKLRLVCGRCGQLYQYVEPQGRPTRERSITGPPMAGAFTGLLLSATMAYLIFVLIQNGENRIPLMVGVEAIGALLSILGLVEGNVARRRSDSIQAWLGSVLLSRSAICSWRWHGA